MEDDSLLAVLREGVQRMRGLTLNRSYFFLRRPLERRLYELARKHCGTQNRWRVGLDTLRDKCGSGSVEKELRQLVGKIIEDDLHHDHMPDYAFSLDEDNIVVRRKSASLQTALPVPETSLRLDEDGTFDEASKLAPGWNIQVLAQDWRAWVLENGITVKAPDAHFLSFCRKRGACKA